MTHYHVCIYRNDKGFEDDLNEKTREGWKLASWRAVRVGGQNDFDIRIIAVYTKETK